MSQIIGEGAVTHGFFKRNSEELKAYYGNLEMNPAKEGQNIEILAKPLSENDLEVLKQAKIYEEGANYQFVYARSR